MISITLKHLVYEKCIDVFFAKVGANFLHPFIANISAMNILGVDLEGKLLDALRLEIQHEIDNEILRQMGSMKYSRQCGKTSTVNAFIVDHIIQSMAKGIT